MSAKTDEFYFRNGILELRVKGSCGHEHTRFSPTSGIDDDSLTEFIPYDPEHPHPCHKDILEFFKQIYPDELLREYCLTLFAACLEGVNRENKIYFQQGKGSNGKSAVMMLNKITFNKYHTVMSPSLLISRSRHQPYVKSVISDAHADDIQNKRYVNIFEIDTDKPLNPNMIKALAGHDRIYTSSPYGAISIVPTWRMFIAVNDFPFIDDADTDNAVWRRIAVIPHISTFVNGRPTDPATHIYPRDEDLGKKFSLWRPFYAGILAWYFENRYLRTGLVVPPAVVTATNAYMNQNKHRMSC